MRKLIPLLLIMLFAVPVMADMDYSSTGDVTIDSVFHGNWKAVDSIILAAGAADTVLEISVSGIASLDAGDRLYIGFGNDSANRVDSATSATTGQTNSNLDTLFIRYPRPAQYGKKRTAFNVRYIFSSAASTTDTFYINMAVWGSSHIEQVEVEDVWISVTTHNKE